MGSTPAATLPLPLPQRVWTDVVFEGRATPATLLANIVGSRNAAIFYHGLFSLDEETRTWLAQQPALVRDIVGRHAAAFAVAAPGLRVAAGRFRPPGGEAAVSAWESLVGRPMGQPDNFVPALLGGEGRLAYLIGALAPLSEAQLRLGLRLGSSHSDRIEALRRLHAVFSRLAGTWTVDDEPFRRPPFDPAMLLADLAVDARGDPVLPGNTAFWSAVLAPAGSGDAAGSQETIGAMAGGPSIDFPSLCELLSSRGLFEYRRGHFMVLFASRVVKKVTPETARDAIEAVRAAGAYPALAMALERAGVDDVAVFAGAARRAAQLSAIGDDDRALRSIAAFQGTVFAVSRSASRGGWPTRTLNEAMTSLVSVEPGARGDYGGRLVRWLGTLVERHQERGIERGGAGAPALGPAVLRLMAGGRDPDAPTVRWEGSLYRVDFAAAEARRLAGVLGEHPRPYIDAASTVVDLADDVSRSPLANDQRRRCGVTLDALLYSAPWESDARELLVRAARSIDGRDASRLADTLHVLADLMLARGLTQYAYAVALGQPGRTTVTAAEVSARHDFGQANDNRAVAWQPPTTSNDDVRGWHVRGALLGLDVALADRSLVAVSSRPPRQPPSMDPIERRAFADVAALADPAALTSAGMETIVSAMRKGRARAARVRTPADVSALASEIRLGPERQALLAWTTARHPEALPALLAPVELLWLGLEGAPVDATLHAWGAPAAPRTGCACLRLDAPRPWDAMAGSRGPAILASTFPDLNLRLTELLWELHMPASLLAPVLAAATLDFLLNAHVRDRDDRRGLEAFVRSLRPDEVEQYLALLTTGGPLVPAEDAVAAEQLAPFPEEPR